MAMLKKIITIAFIFFLLVFERLPDAKRKD